MRVFKCLTQVFLSLLVACFFVMPGIAQSITGTITGTVTDSNGSTLSNVNVTLIGEKTGESRNLVTNEEGKFVFSAVQPGPYTVKLELQNFQSFEKKNTVLSANETLALGEIALTAGNVNETVTVVSEGATIEKDTSDLTARLTSDQIDLISTKGRDVTSLLRLLPGTSNNDDIESAGDGFGTDLPNVSGQRGRSTTASIDGLTASEASGSNKLSMTISQDAVSEVKVLRNNYAAEYGNNGGAMINIISKGGGKDYKGSAYYFLRNEALNATPFFSNKASLRKPRYRYNIWGANFGGPMPLPNFGEGGPTVLKDKAFFFFSYEKPHTQTPLDPVFVTVPTALERTGDFSQSINASNAKVYITDPLKAGSSGVACSAANTTNCFTDPTRATTANPTGLNIIPLARFNSSGLALLNYFPLPNASGGRTAAGGAYNYVTQSPIDVPKQSILLRLDFKPTQNDSIYWKMQRWTSDNEGTATSGWPGGDANRWGISSHYLYKDNGWSANWVHVFNSNIVNEFNFGMRSSSEGFIPSDGVAESLQRSRLNYTAAQIFPANNTLGTIPRATGWTGVLGVAPANISWLDRWGEYGKDYITPSFADNLSVNYGDHNLKFGVYYERLKNSEARGGNWSGAFSFASNNNNYTAALGNTGYPYANAIIGNFANYLESSGRPFTNLEITQVQWYAQDQWKVNQNLTVNYGMRFVYSSPFAQIDGQGSNFVPSLYSSANAVQFYQSVCAVSYTPPATCPAASRRARNPVTGETFALTGANATLLSTATVVPGTGSLTNGLMLTSDPNTPEGWRITQAVNYEPRVGFSYDLFGKGKTVIRSMFGIYHSARTGGGTNNGNLAQNPPSTRTFSIDFGNIDNLNSLVGTSLNRAQALSFTYELNSNTPTSYNWSFGVQQDIGFKTVLEVSYVGTRGRHLGELRNINQIPDGAKLGTNNIDPVSGTRIADDYLRPYRGYGNIGQITWSGNSQYDGLQAQINRRYSNNFQFGVAYSYAKSLDSANDDVDDVFNGRPYRAFNYGVSNFDQTHILTANYIYDVPKLSRIWSNGFTNNGIVKVLLDDWQISGTTSFATGKPKTFANGPSGTGLTWTYNAGTVTIPNGVANGATCPGGSTQTVSGTSVVCTMIQDFTGGTVNARPFLTCDPNKGATGSDATGSPYVFNPSCFASPTALGQIGNLGRNIIRLPSTFNNDLAFFKNIKMGERRGVQLRWEIYNLFNKANFRDVNGVMNFGLVPTTTNGVITGATVQQTNNSFGTANSARAPRVMQASIRINF